MSRIPGFRKRDRAGRIGAVREAAGTLDASVLDGGISFTQADRMIENALGVMAIPLGVATNFCINGRDVLVPMAIEEPSVVAAASKAALACRDAGGFEASCGASLSIGQIQIINPGPGAAERIEAVVPRILGTANACSNTLPDLGRGAKSVSSRTIRAPSGTMLIVELLVDVGDAMGANITNTMCEAVSPIIEKAAGGRALLRILSNYSTGRMARASAVFPSGKLGADVVRDMVLTYEFADNDVYRAVTHNKGVMNGIIAVANATGQDSRAIDAAAHAWAARSGRYRSLTTWSLNEAGDLVGSIDVPMSVGVLGGVINVHPTAKACLGILGVDSAAELAGVMAAAGLAQNFGAMLALATDGIQKGHMRLHARNVAAAAGVPPHLIDDVAATMAREGNITPARARALAGIGVSDGQSNDAHQ